MSESGDRRRGFRLVPGGGEHPSPAPASADAEREHVHVLVITERGAVTASVMEALAADKIWDDFTLPRPVFFDLAELEMPVEAMSKNYDACVLQFLSTCARVNDEDGAPVTEREIVREIGPGLRLPHYKNTLEEVLAQLEGAGLIERVVRDDGEDAWVYMGPD